MNIIYAAAKKLADHLAAQLGLPVDVLQEEPDREAQFPGVAVVQRRLTADWQVNATAKFDPVTQNLFVRLGDFVGTWELRIYAATPPEREKYEEAIWNIFNANSSAPGRIVLTWVDLEVGGAQIGYDPVLSFDLDSTTWREEFAWSKKRFAFLEVEVGIPIVVRRSNVPEVASLRLAQGLVEEWQDTVASNPSFEAVQVNEDGTISLSS